MTADRLSSRLPTPISTFVGRRAELRAVAAATRAARLVTVTGAGGCGKTRLTAEAARRLVPEHPDGVAWADLGPLDHPDLVTGVVAVALGVRDAPGEPLTETLSRHLADRRVLLVLDGCEHVLGGVTGLVDHLLRTSALVTVLATSREPLGVEGERVWRVPSLSLPEDGSVEAVLRSEAGQLFVQRATAADAGFRLTAQSSGAVAEICTRLDGIALAVELAAARVRMMAPDQIATGLVDRFRLLRGGARRALPRQRTLEASVAWSHDLLPGDERALLAALSAFAGTFPLEAVEWMGPAAGIRRSEVLDVATGLVDRSLLHVERHPPGTRLRLLETVREFARARLVDSERADAVLDAHLAYCAHVAGEAAVGLVGPEAEGWLRRLDLHVDDLRRALDRCLEHGPSAPGLRLVADLHWYWRARHPSEGRARLAAALAAAPSDDPARARALVVSAALAMMTGDLEQAGPLAGEALELARRRGEDGVVGEALSFLGWQAVLGGAEPDLAVATLEEAVEASTAAGDTAYAALALNAIGFALTGTPRSSEAGTYLDRGLDLAAEIGFTRPAVEGAIWRALLELVEGRFEVAAHRLFTALDRPDWGLDPFFRALGCSLSAEALGALGRYGAAAEQVARGREVAEAHRDAFGAAQVRRASGWLHYAEGRFDEAAQDLEAASTALADMDRRECVRCEGLRAAVDVARGCVEDAAARLVPAVPAARATRSLRSLVPVLAASAAVARRRGEPVVAEDRLHEVLAASSEAGHRPGLCDALDGLASTAADREDFVAAARLHGASSALRRSIGYVRHPVDRRHLDDERSRLSSALGHEGLRAAMADGAALSEDDALAYARRGRGPRRRPAVGWESLTPAEAQVVQLVTEGLTNPEIGERLFISRRTVQTHLRHVFAKVGVATRAELAAKAVARTARP